MKHDPTSKENLWDVLLKSMPGITLSQLAVLRTLVESMPGRVKTILKSKGGHTKY